jgi:undecaprenyl-diphosphatase
MIKKREVIFFLAAIACILTSVYFDSQISQAVSLARNSFLDNILIGITFASSAVIIFFVLTSLFLWKEHKRKWILPLWFTLAFSAIASFVLKITVHRMRPYQLGVVTALPFLQEASHTVWDFSFPSFQAILAFCSIPILNKEFPRFRYVWIAFACLVALSRVYFGVHFLSDVIAGALIGYLIGTVVVKGEKEYKLSEKILRKIFGD